MRKIVAGLFISLDGVVESANDWIGPWFSPEVGQAVGSMIATAMPSALAAMAAFIALTISVTELVSEPVHWYLHPTRATASWMPYWVGTKNGLVVTWLTNTKFHWG